ncbi:hypothetical protein BABINDRAFT_165729 [Babjeviella inositovora NRRL Y-12698]|uniref:Uncharacterized protein n=1 Tax=Babjeviella inositovora NRRL Y-12698 TaxID=984486 RepID=A0A1E3QTJ5_9ASCO|nr:uncharacterized protein BABINDRAFT_165729 [Babjeviella inositovora NRRL Y-12698]ODQ81006.1 hypothetical protein BABINDRAFT_165729 [Babjeviella inositovora NRRL Y-12698]
MPSDALVIGCSVAIPAAVAIVVIFVLWLKTLSRFKKEAREEIDIDADDQLSFDNLANQSKYFQVKPLAEGSSGDSDSTRDIQRQNQFVYPKESDASRDSLPKLQPSHIAHALIAFSGLNSFAHPEPDGALSYYDTMVPVLPEGSDGKPLDYAKRISNPNLLNYTSTLSHNHSGSRDGSFTPLGLSSTRNSSRLSIANANLVSSPKPQPHNLTNLSMSVVRPTKFELHSAQSSIADDRRPHHVANDSMVSGFSQIDSTVGSDPFKSDTASPAKPVAAFITEHVQEELEPRVRVSSAITNLNGAMNEQGTQKLDFEAEEAAHPYKSLV